MEPRLGRTGAQAVEAGQLGEAPGQDPRKRELGDDWGEELDNAHRPGAAGVRRGTFRRGELLVRLNDQ